MHRVRLHQLEQHLVVVRRERLYGPNLAAEGLIGHSAQLAAHDVHGQHPRLPGGEGRSGAGGGRRGRRGVGRGRGVRVEGVAGAEGGQLC